MRKILVPTDFSENAANAIEHAAQIAISLHYKLILLHVGNPITNQGSEQKLEIICRALVDSFTDLNCDFYIVNGEDIPAEIVAASDRYNVEMIVMGTKGLINIRKILFSSNTASVIGKATCTVLSVPGNTGFTKPKRILFATNFEREDIKAALQIIKIARPFNASVIIAHVMSESAVEEVERTKIQMFTREVSLLTDYPRISFKLSSENTVTMGLDALIESTNADVIAMRTHRRTLFEKIINPSITQKFAEESQIPLLAFHS
jgi:nucleotide-binding universal stress UspA family protein